MTATELLALAQAGGPFGLIVLLIILLSRGTLVWDREHKAILGQLQERLDAAEQREGEWKQLAITTTGLIERTLSKATTPRQPSPKNSGSNGRLPP